MLSSSPLLLTKDKIIHIIGIGGIGMSAIAKLLHHIGYIVQGSDLSNGYNVQTLRKLGINVFASHQKNNIKNVSIIFKSTAVPDDNMEVEAAKINGIPVANRAEILTELLKLKHTIAISGTHGKTTTTSMLGSIFESAAYDPTIITGGIMNLYNDNVRLGNGNWNIVEADESDGTFISLPKSICVVTNIEMDHIDYYKSYKKLLNHFHKFINDVPFHGYAVICEKSAKLLNISNRQSLTCSITSNTADVQAVNIEHNKHLTSFDITTSHKLSCVKIPNVVINVPGDHNVHNATAAIAVALKLGIPSGQIKLGLQKYSGVRRRFSCIGQFNEADVIDDYAHHPTEIVVTINAAKRLCPTNNKVIAVIQPHRYTRIQNLFSEYVSIASHCDYVIFLPVYSAGERLIENCTSHDIVIQSKGNEQNKYIKYLEEADSLPQELQKIVNKGDKILLMGAGDITNYSHKLVK